MVDSLYARQDVDKYLLTKTITYHKSSSTIVDLSTNETSEDDDTSYSIKAQVTIQNLDSEYVKEGRLKQGDLVGLFRHEYVKDSNGVEIDPVLVPKQFDRIEFLGRKFTIKSCTPATSEDDGIIAWDFTAGESS